MAHGPAAVTRPPSLLEKGGAATNGVVVSGFVVFVITRVNW